MTTKSAFPVPGAYGASDSGMALRDWFAGQALAGYLASVSTPEVMTLCSQAAKARGMEEEPFIAKVAYTFADAMLLERSK
ncbi:hypothetical protein [Mesorhizobium sp. NZP2298]|uniref:hypothetical protein n=1 Tax=Mesorhizobium sp. NZP2298 TaxID=2483403 RepID=UPI001553FAFF|nr:hypothetical protein [Mesorhizobium sp. NZP2298]QKC99158.1 hypothetical protein EB231_34780 [Mesorhizobium sp. NZP2298]